MSRLNNARFRMETLLLISCVKKFLNICIMKAGVSDKVPVLKNV